jgi:hypothetical protein
VDLHLKTGLLPKIVGGISLLLLDPDTKEKVLSYKGLKAFDANGKELNVKMNLIPQGQPELYAVNLHASGKNLVYPVTIDPLTTAEWSRIGTQGVSNGDVTKLGSAVAVCDFNGDTYDDLAISAPGARREWV